jgi:two-component system, OmpR family, sensor histidine kinase KdpD
MGRGRLRVLLGAAPGVGKTYAMLQEAHRLREAGKDVVVAFVEAHDRPATAALLDGLEVIPRRTVGYRGLELTELDRAAVLERHPEIALVDELAHTNAPGSEHVKRWEDVEDLLNAGIDVISTVNIQHIESLNDVVTRITRVPQRETVPDAVLRSADQIELVDLTPEALRSRLSAGEIYAANRIDAALSNYFRVGNLTALRELALLWLADEVDSSLLKYRFDHGIDSTWEARERVVVALTGGPEGETLLRRGARIAARASGGELLAVHVTSEDGLREPHAGSLEAQHRLTEQLGGTFHQVIGSDVPTALVEFARAANATQLVLGVSRRSRLLALLTGPGIGAAVIRESGDIDVHIVSHAGAGRGLILPRGSGGLTVRRRVYGFILTVVGAPLLTWLLVSLRNPSAMTSDVLAFQLFAVVVALVGGIWPALLAAVLSGLTLDYFFVPPIYTVTIAEPTHLIAIILYVVISVLVSIVVDLAARRTRSALRSAAESELLAGVAGSVIRGRDALQALVSTTREAFGLSEVRLLAGDQVLASDGAGAGERGGDRDGDGDGNGDGDGDDDRDGDGDREGDGTERGARTVLPVGDRAALQLFGRDVRASDRRLLAVIVSQLDAALEHQDLSDAASEVGPLTETDRVRTALLAALGHDLRRPLAAATAAVTALSASGLSLSDRDRADLLETAEGSLASLASLITNLLDVSRVQAGVLAVSLASVDIEDVVAWVLDELSLGPALVDLDIGPQLPEVRADAVLLQRALVNLLTNALRYSPPNTPVRVSASEFAGHVEIRVADTGPGVPDEARELIFVPFQRLGDTDNDTGIGLGLALSKGFVEGMGGTLSAEDTPGGGLTMVISLPAAEPDAGRVNAGRVDAGRVDGGRVDAGRADGGRASR